MKQAAIDFASTLVYRRVIGFSPSQAEVKDWLQASLFLKDSHIEQVMLTIIPEARKGAAKTATEIHRRGCNTVAQKGGQQRSVDGSRKCAKAEWQGSEEGSTMGQAARRAGWRSRVEELQQALEVIPVIFLNKKNNQAFKCSSSKSLNFSGLLKVRNALHTFDYDSHIVFII